MAIAYLNRRAAKPAAHRIERRSRKRTMQATAGMAGRFALWTIGFFLIGWLVAAGFYGLLVSA
ncbi:MAG: hypothetical protein M3Z11_05260 [Candidatus Dormibacteraeota bacterium]|nr:hypothetical protein [Candidatus Dormibacteraeota bacterium]